MTTGRRARAIGLAIAIAVGFAACSSEESEPSASAEAAQVRVVSQNLLHGIACPADSDGCDLPGRVALFAQQLDEAECPELVSVQEANERMVDHLRTEIVEVCDGRYELVEPDASGVITSREFSGLRLHLTRLLAGDIARVLAELER